MKKSLYILVIVLSLIILSACNKTISLKAAIVYKMGGAQPIARTTFYLSKKDLETSVKEAGIKVQSNAVAEWVIASYPSPLEKKDPNKFVKAFEPYIVSTVTTDFEGTANFDSVPPGKYYIIGITQTRSGRAVWNLEVDTEKTQTIILDQNNAAYTS